MQLRRFCSNPCASRCFSTRRAIMEPMTSKKTAAKPAATPPEPPTGDRLQKILAQAGIASRRKAEEIILEGRVIVNGQVVTELGTRADATKDHIRVDGKLLHGPEQQRYYMLN